MEFLESCTARYQKCSALLIFRMSHQLQVLRSKPQTEFQRLKLEEILGEIYGFSRRRVLKLTARRKV